MVDNNQFVEDLITLRDDGQLSLQNMWNQQTGDKDFSVDLNVEHEGTIFVDGIYLLHHPIQELADLKLLLQISPEVARARADQRDKYRSDPEYLEYKNQLMQKYDLPYFEKYASNADLIINNDSYENPYIEKSKN